VPRRPDEEGPEPEDGRAAERLRQHLESRFKPDDWPEDAAIEDARDRSSEETGQAISDEADASGTSTEQDHEDDQPELDGDDDADDSPASLDLEEREEPPESDPYQLNDDEGED
jgi:hypothetical protein